MSTPTTTDAVELLACPFCNSTASHRVFVSEGQFYICCRRCGAQGPRSDNAEVAWNTRAQATSEIRRADHV